MDKSNIIHTKCRRLYNLVLIFMVQFLLVRSFSSTLSSSLGRRCRSSYSVGFTRLSSREGTSNESDSSKAKEKVAEYKQSSASTTSMEDYANPSNINDQVFSAISEDGSVKITACTARNIVNDLMIMHTMTAVPADAIGRTVVCALMMSNGMQAEQTCQITFNADGPLRGVVAISDGVGNVRGYVGSPMLGDIELSEALGKGMVQVVKNHPDWSNPYNGITSIRHGDIDRDIGAYLAESEQRSCALAAATSVNGILCTAAGGYLIEQLPNATPETLARVEKNLATLVEKDGSDKLPTNLLLKGITPVEIAETILDGLGMVPLQQILPKFQCTCSSQKLVRALRLIPRKEVDEILEDEEKIEARCEFCGTTYSMGPDEIRKELDNAKGDPSLDADFEEENEKK
jgi:molecular chaperone Hsp33